MNEALTELLEKSLPLLACPKCPDDDLELSSGIALRCSSCGARYPVVDGIVDFFVDYRPGKSLSQRIMENRTVVGIYEDRWRPWFTRLGSKITYDDEKAWLEAQVSGRPVRTALDLACGTGRYARILTDLHRPEVVFAADLSMPMLEEAGRMAAQRGYTSILFMRCDAQKLPFKDGLIDRLNCFGALHLFPDPFGAIDELARVGSDEACLTCLTACRSDKTRRAWGQQWFSRLASFRFFDLDELEAGLESSGFMKAGFQQDNTSVMFSATREPRS